MGLALDPLLSIPNCLNDGDEDVEDDDALHDGENPLELVDASLVLSVGGVEISESDLLESTGLLVVERLSYTVCFMVCSDFDDGPILAAFGACDGAEFEGDQCAREHKMWSESPEPELHVGNERVNCNAGSPSPSSSWKKSLFLLEKLPL